MQQLFGGRFSAEDCGALLVEVLLVLIPSLSARSFPFLSVFVFSWPLSPPGEMVSQSGQPTTAVLHMFVTNAASNFPRQIHFAKPSANAFLEHLTLELYFMHHCHPFPQPLVGTRGIIVLIFPVHNFTGRRHHAEMKWKLGGNFAPKIVRSWHAQTGACTEWLPREKYWEGFFFS